MLCTDGPCEIDAESAARLERNGIAVREDRVARLEGRDGILSASCSRAASRSPRRALFFTTGQYAAVRSAAAARLRDQREGHGAHRQVRNDAPAGLFVAGDASRAVQWVVVAAAEGAEAAFAINTDLIKEDLSLSGVRFRLPASQLGAPALSRLGYWT